MRENESLNDEVKCGHNKWSIGYDGVTGGVVIKYCYHPLEGEIILYDATAKDFRNLGEMFLSLARQGEKIEA